MKKRGRKREIKRTVSTRAVPLVVQGLPHLRQSFIEASSEDTEILNESTEVSKNQSVSADDNDEQNDAATLVSTPVSQINEVVKPEEDCQLAVEETRNREIENESKLSADEIQNTETESDTSLSSKCNDGHMADEVFVGDKASCNSEKADQLQDIAPDKTVDTDVAVPNNSHSTDGKTLKQVNDPDDQEVALKQINDPNDQELVLKQINNPDDQELATRNTVTDHEQAASTEVAVQVESSSSLHDESKQTEEVMASLEYENSAPAMIGPPQPPKEFFERVNQDRDSDSEEKLEVKVNTEGISTKECMEPKIQTPKKDDRLNIKNSVPATTQKNFQEKSVTGTVTEVEVQTSKDKQISIKVIRKARPKKQVSPAKSTDQNQTSGSKPGIDEVLKQEKTEPVKEEAKVEYISVYSNEDRKKRVGAKKSQELKLKGEAVTSRVESSESLAGQKQEVKIAPFPEPMLVDPAQLERETEQYYKEVGSVSCISTSRSVKQKTACLTPSQIAKIAKSYPAAAADDEASREMQAAWAALHQYWTQVQENPYDFNGWTLLLNHVETMDNIEAARSAFEGFLPLYPYCFAYWVKLSDLELKFSDLEQCLGVLFSGSKAVPFCTELWTPLLKKFRDYAEKENMSDDIVRGMYEFAIDNMGLSWHSSPIWELYIDYEQKTKEDLVRVMNLYRRLLAVPNKLYNKHWDNLLALVRDNHPRNLMSVGEYYRLKKHVCGVLDVQFNPPPMVPPNRLLKPQADDKIQSSMKEMIIANLIPVYEASEKAVDKRWKYEEKIKRPYFHVKPLEKKQIKTWREYIDFEIKEDDPVRVITLFERCLVPCALYEEFWRKYASYMEDHVLNVANSKYADVNYTPGCFSSETVAEASDSKNTGDKTCEEKTDKSSDDKENKKTDLLTQTGERFSINLPLKTEMINEEKEYAVATDNEIWDSDNKAVGVTREIKFEVMFLLNRLCEGVGVGGKVLTPPSLAPSAILQVLTWEDVRQIYRRAAWIHCPSKPLLLMQWAEFEELQGNVQTARDLLNTVIAKQPNLLKARLQLIELERRSKQYDRVEELFGQTYAAFKGTRIKSCIAIRYARFVFKLKEEDEKALMILRKALKKDKSNIHLYHHVFDICYQRRPVDCDGVLAAVMLALASKDVPLEEKHWFCIKRSDFLREHGTASQLKHAKIEAAEIELKLEKERLEKAKKEAEIAKREREEKEQAEKERIAKEAALLNSCKKTEEVQMSSEEAKAGNESSSKGVINATAENGGTIIRPLEPPKLLMDIMNITGKKDSESKERRGRKRSGSPHHHRSSKRSSRNSRREREDSRERGEIRELGEIREKGEIREHRRSSKRAKRSRERRHSSSSKKKSKDDGQEVLYASDGSVLYDPRQATLKEATDKDNANHPGQAFPAPGQVMQGFPNQIQNFPAPGMPGYANQQVPSFPPPSLPVQSGVNDGKNYTAMPPTWEINTPSLANYGYGGSHGMVKENQNNLYSRYYDLLNQGYKTKDREQSQMQFPSPNMPNAIGGNTGTPESARPPMSYLPPPPIPQGILGDSLFNQGNLANLNRPFGRGDLTQNFEMCNARPPFPVPGMNPRVPPPPFKRQEESHMRPFHMEGQPPLLPPFPLKIHPPPLLPNQSCDQHPPGTRDTNSSLPHHSTNPSSNLLPPGILPVTPNQPITGPPGTIPFSEESKVLPSGRNDINTMAVMGKGQPNSSGTSDLSQDDRTSSSGRNNVNVAGMMKEQKSKNSTDEPTADSEEMKVVSSGRNTINVAALMKDRKFSTSDAAPGANVSKDHDAKNESKKLHHKSRNHDRKQFGYDKRRSGNRSMGQMGSGNMHGPSGQPMPFNNKPPLQPLLGPYPRDISSGNAFNVPDWLINDGGELRLSATQNGISLLRYLPRYMNEQGHKTIFHSLRKSVKWHQQCVNVPDNNNWLSLPKLVSWVGPCDYEKDGAVLSANTNWPPEIVDLLHRLNSFSSCSFNSCFLSLYTNGFAHHPWHNEEHQALQKNPTIATISLGGTRSLEMRNTNGPGFLRLPLFPGSLYVLEGASQTDWLYQIPKEPEIMAERISLSFRTMMMIKGVTV